MDTRTLYPKLGPCSLSMSVLLTSLSKLYPVSSSYWIRMPRSLRTSHVFHQIAIKIVEEIVHRNLISSRIQKGHPRKSQQSKYDHAFIEYKRTCPWYSDWNQSQSTSGAAIYSIFFLLASSRTMLSSATVQCHYCFSHPMFSSYLRKRKKCLIFTFASCMNSLQDADVNVKLFFLIRF